MATQVTNLYFQTPSCPLSLTHPPSLTAFSHSLSHSLSPAPSLPHSLSHSLTLETLSRAAFSLSVSLALSCGLRAKRCERVRVVVLRELRTAERRVLRTGELSVLRCLLLLSGRLLLSLLLLSFLLFCCGCLRVPRACLLARCVTGLHFRSVL